MFAAFICAALSVCFGIRSRINSALVDIDLEKMYEKFIDLPELDFKKAIIFNSGINMTENEKRLAKKHGYLIIAACFLAAEVALFAISPFWNLLCPNC